MPNSDTRDIFLYPYLTLIFFSVRFGIASSGRVMFDDLAVIPDAGEQSLSVYTADVHIPDKARGLYVLQVNYRTNNPQAPPNFYQCADVMVI